MDEYRIARRVLMEGVSGGSKWRASTRETERLGWMDGVKGALGHRGMTAQATRQCEKDWKEWRALVAGAYVAE